MSRSKTIKASILLLTAFVFIPCWLRAQFYFGTDLSYINEMEDCGAVYKENNTPKDPYEIMRDHGANLVRLRLWHTPSWYDNLNQGHRYSDFEDVKQSIIRARTLGMQVLLDFHLSDTWADPSHQVVPAAWAGVVDDLPVLQDSLYNYIYQTLFRLQSESYLPDIVQIGNETNKGILLSQQVNDQGWSVSWPRNAALFNIAIQAVRDIEFHFDVPIRVALHIADPSELDWWIGQFWMNNVRDFDIIGMSYYYEYHDDLIGDVDDAIDNMKASYPTKDVMIFETGYPWTTGFEDNANNLLHTPYPGYPISRSNQRQWLIDLAQEVIDHGGKGVVYWEPGWVSTNCYTRFGKGSNWENATFFDFNDNLTEDAGVGWMGYAYDFPSAIGDESGKSSYIIYYRSGNLFLHNLNGVRVNGNFKISVISMDGKNISKGNLFLEEDVGDQKLFEGNLIPGAYIVSLIGFNQSFVQRFIVN